MKTSTYFLIALLGLAPALALPPPGEQQTKIPRAEVQFFEPKKFTDVKDTYTGDYERTTYLDQIRDYVIDQSKYYVPDGWHLSVTFTDIDMAGDFEPWRGPQFDDIRIVKDIYPPRINLTFQLVDPEGHVVKEGKRELKDLAFMMKINMSFRDDPVRHEKALLDDWFRAEFPRVKK
jgi:hypothetical protein